jgi:hypothetical protein
MSDLPERFLTRAEMHKLLIERGYPVGFGTLEKLCSPAIGQGPPVAAFWPGRRNDRPLYDPAQALAWAEHRLLKSPKQSQDQ